MFLQEGGLTMKNFKFITGVVCGAVLFSGVSAIANEIMARLSNQPIYVDGQKIEMTAYNINDNNYVKLRDIGKAVDFLVAYNEYSNSVEIDSERPYSEVRIDHEGKLAITEKILDGTDWAREDFSLQANPAIFDDVYTRGAYNAIRQSLVDINEIVAYTDENGFNPYYNYAHFIGTSQTRDSMTSVLGRIFGYYNFEFIAESYTKNRHEYKGYNICKVNIHDFFSPANEATDSFIKEVNALSSDREKVIKLNHYLCSKLTYGMGEGSNTNLLFTSEEQIKGTCGAYTSNFEYLCQRVNIPCIMIIGENHSWNAVYVEGKWLYVDVTGNDTGDNPLKQDMILLAETFSKQDENPKRTEFSKEILAPNSTAK